MSTLHQPPFPVQTTRPSSSTSAMSAGHQARPAASPGDPASSCHPIRHRSRRCCGRHRRGGYGPGRAAVASRRLRPHHAPFGVSAAKGTTSRQLHQPGPTARDNTAGRVGLSTDGTQVGVPPRRLQFLARLDCTGPVLVRGV